MSEHVVCFRSRVSPFVCYQEWTPHGLLRSTRTPVNVMWWPTADAAREWLAERGLSDGDPVPVGTPGYFTAHAIPLVEASFDEDLCVGVLFELPAELLRRTGFFMPRPEPEAPAPKHSPPPVRVRPAAVRTGQAVFAFGD